MAILFRALSDVGIKPRDEFFQIVRGRPTVLEFARRLSFQIVLGRPTISEFAVETTPPMLDFTIISTAGSLSDVTGANPDSAI